MNARLVILTALILAAGCDAGEPTPYPKAKDVAQDGEGNNGDAVAGDVTVVDAADAVAEDAGPPVPLTCEEFSTLFVEELGKRAGAWDACTQDSGCVLLIPELKCTSAGTTVKECPWAAGNPLDFAVESVAIEDALCPDAPADCIATPGCPEHEAWCDGGHCKARLVNP